MENDALRFQINEYFDSFLTHDPKKEPPKGEKELAASRTIIAYPQIIDYYILNKEEHGDEVIAANIDETSAVNAIFIEQVPQLVELLKPTAFYSKAQNTYRDALDRVLYLKQVIENNDGYKVFYYKGNPIKRESDLHVMFRLVCYNDKYDVNSEVNNGRGPVDYKISDGANDKTLIEFKLASSKSLRRNLQNQMEIYAAANQTKLQIKVILYFSQKEYDNVSKLLEEMKLQGEENIVLIDARNDNKPSASVATKL
ncbi:MAG: hypothetical protein LBP79_05685 [Clostridiales bacterium]|nr:hypothetical protein [Clostridiales bacterium]